MKSEPHPDPSGIRIPWGSAIAAAPRCAAAVMLAVLVVLPCAARADAPTFAPTFSPSRIAVGGVSRLSYVISASESTTDLALVEPFPGGIRVASAPGVTATCLAVVSAVPGEDAVRIEIERMPAGASCTVSLNVTSVTEGEHSLGMATLNSSVGSSVAPPVALTVAADAPRLDVSLSPASVSFGGTSRLTYALDVSSLPAFAFVGVSDALPDGLVIASPALLETDCTLSSQDFRAGASRLSFAPFFVGTSRACSVSLDVVARTGGPLDVDSSELRSDASVVARGAARLTVVPPGMLRASLDVVDDPLGPGETGTLVIELASLNRDDTVTDIALDVELAPVALRAAGTESGACGAGSTLSGADTIRLTGARLEPGAACRIAVPITVSGATGPGRYLVSSSAPTGIASGRPVEGAPATAVLAVAGAPAVSLDVTPATAVPGEVVSLALTLDNASTTGEATGISATVSSPVPWGALALPDPTGACGAGASLALASGGSGETVLALSGATLSAGASCTVEVEIALPDELPTGTYRFEVPEVVGTVGGVTSTARGAHADLSVIGAPRLRLEILEEGEPGGTVTMRVEIAHGPEEPGPASAIGFEIDLDASVAGLVAVGVPGAGACGAGSTVTGGATLAFAGGVLEPGEVCVFDVELELPAALPIDRHAVRSGPLSATVDGRAVTAPGSTAWLDVLGVRVSKEFVDDPVFPGRDATLRFVLTNHSATAAASSIAFVDDLEGMLAGTTAVGFTPDPPCGAGSSLLGTAQLQLLGGELAPGATCSFDVTVRIPADAPPEAYTNRTREGSADHGAGPVRVPAAADQLIVADPLMFSARFVEDFGHPGGSATLRFAIANADPDNPATRVGFTLDLEAALAGLTASGLPMSDVCGAGSTLSSEGGLTLSAATVDPASSCTFDVQVAIPSPVPLGSLIAGRASDLGADLGGATIRAVGPAVALDLLFFELALELSEARPGEVTTATYTVTSIDGAAVTDDLRFTHPSSEAVEGLEAVDGSLESSCGGGGSLTGSDVLQFSGISVEAGAGCTLTVDLLVPDGAAPGRYATSTGALFAAGAQVGLPAAGEFVVLEPLIDADAGPDAGDDAGPDAGPDAGGDAGPDATEDASPDGGSDGGDVPGDAADGSDLGDASGDSGSADGGPGTGSGGGGCGCASSSRRGAAPLPALLPALAAVAALGFTRRRR